MLKKVLSLVLITLVFHCTSWCFGSDNKTKQGIEDVGKNDYFKDVIKARNYGIKFIKSNTKRTFSKINIGKKKSTDLWMWDYVPNK